MITFIFGLNHIYNKHNMPSFMGRKLSDTNNIMLDSFVNQYREKNTNYYQKLKNKIKQQCREDETVL